MAESKQTFDRSIVDGPILNAIWKLAWPTMLQNIIAGFQGIVDHVMVGHVVGYVGNAAIGVSWQIFLVVVVFISSLFSGMGVMVARFAGAGEADKVNRVVYQALLAAVVLACGILAPIGYALAPDLLDIVHAAPAVKAEALPYLRIMFVFSIGMLLFFMLGGALRSAGDAKTPLRLGIVLTVLNLCFNVIFIRGLGPVPAFGTRGAAMGTTLAAGIVGLAGLYLLFSGKLPVRLRALKSWRPDFRIVVSLFRFGLPTGFQGIAMNVGGVLLLRFIGSLQESAEAQAAYTVGYTQLFSLITWTSVGLMSAAAAAAGQNLGAKKPHRTRAVVKTGAKIGLFLAASIGTAFMLIPDQLFSVFGISEVQVLQIGTQLLRVLSISGLFVTVALVYTGGLQGTGDTRSPMYITIFSQLIIPIGFCAILQALGHLQALDIWIAILLGHFSRALLTILRFRQGGWEHIHVELHS